MSPDPFAAFSVPGPPDFVVRWEELDTRFDWIRALRGTPQDPVHHAEGDVWIHTRAVAEEMAKLRAFREAGDLERGIAFTAALLHDVAKPRCTRESEDGRIHAKGHSTKGAIEARRILWRLGTPLALREAVVGLVRHHQAPFWLFEREDPRGLLLRIGETAPCDLLAMLAEADLRGRICADQARLLDQVALFHAYAEEQRCLRGPYPFPSDHARFRFFGGRQRDPDHAPHEAFRSEVVLMSGFPGAGKDHWLARHVPDLPVVSLDRLRLLHDVDPEDDQGALVQRAREEARSYLRDGRPFAWNATNVSRRLRALALRLFADYDARIRIVYVEASEPTLRAQNRSRKAPVPDHVLDALLDRWEVPDRTEAHEVGYAVASAP